MEVTNLFRPTLNLNPLIMRPFAETLDRCWRLWRETFHLVLIGQIFVESLFIEHNYVPHLRVRQKYEVSAMVRSNVFYSKTVRNSCYPFSTTF